MAIEVVDAGALKQRDLCLRLYAHAPRVSYLKQPPGNQGSSRGWPAPVCVFTPVILELSSSLSKVFVSHSFHFLNTKCTK